MKKTLRDTAAIIIIIVGFTGILHCCIEALPPAACEIQQGGC